MAMAYRNKTIWNPTTGQTIRFLKTAAETNGQFLEMESTFGIHSKEPPLHYHPNQDESFTVLSGELVVRMNGEIKQFAAGTRFEVPRGTSHAMWNDSSLPAIVNWRVSPALNTEMFFENTMGLAMDGKTNAKGMPNILQIALIANKYDNIFRLSKPSFAVQKIVFSILTPFAYLAGYRPSYDKYLN